jgi:hypothetical protein
MDDLKPKLDRGARSLRRMIREAMEMGDAFCEVGNAKASADAWKMVSLLAAAHSHGRSLSIETDGGVIAPAFGGGK